MDKSKKFFVEADLRDMAECLTDYAYESTDQCKYWSISVLAKTIVVNGQASFCSRGEAQSNLTTFLMETLPIMKASDKKLEPIVKKTKELLAEDEDTIIRQVIHLRDLLIARGTLRINEHYY